MYSREGIKYLWPSNNQSLEKSNQTDKMMKTILLLAFAVFVSGAPVNEENTIRKLLGELIHKLDNAMTNLPKVHTGKEIFMRDLKTDGKCAEDVFCLAEEELKLKVSGLTKYEDFRTDKPLMRELHVYNVHYGNCKVEPADEASVQIPLKDFLSDIKKCVQKEYGKK